MSKKGGVMDILEKMDRRIPCGEDFDLDFNEPHEFSGIPESKAPCRETLGKKDDDSSKGIIKGLMRDSLRWFKRNWELEAELMAAKTTEKKLRLQLAEKADECLRLQGNIELLEYQLRVLAGSRSLRKV